MTCCSWNLRQDWRIVLIFSVETAISPSWQTRSIFYCTIATVNTWLLMGFLPGWRTRWVHAVFTDAERLHGLLTILQRMQLLPWMSLHLSATQENTSDTSHRRVNSGLLMKSAFLNCWILNFSILNLSQTMKMKPSIYLKTSVFQAKEVDFNLRTVLGNKPENLT